MYFFTLYKHTLVSLCAPLLCKRKVWMNGVLFFQNHCVCLDVSVCHLYLLINVHHIWNHKGKYFYQFFKKIFPCLATMAQNTAIENIMKTFQCCCTWAIIIWICLWGYVIIFICNSACTNSCVEGVTLYNDKAVKAMLSYIFAMQPCQLCFIAYGCIQYVKSQSAPQEWDFSGCLLYQLLVCCLNLCYFSVFFQNATATLATILSTFPYCCSPCTLEHLLSLGCACSISAFQKQNMSNN